MSKHRRNAILIAGILALSIVFWTWLLLTYGASEIVAFIGVENGYYVMFLIALFGGVSSFSGVTYVATIITLASGGLNPLGLALASGLGISVGDTIYYYISKLGLREVAAESRFAQHIERFTYWLLERPAWQRFLGIYGYTGFTPLPNDVLTIVLGLTNQPYRLVLPALVLGNMTLTLLIALFGTQLAFLG